MITSYIQIKNAIQILKQVLPWPSFKTLIPFDMKKEPINLRSLQKLLVEVAYMLYYLHIQGSSCYISNKIFLSPPLGQGHQAKLTIILPADQNQTKDMFMEEIIQKDFIHAKLEQQSQCVDMMQYYIEMILKQIEQCKNQGFIFNSPINQFIMATEIGQFSYIYNTTIKPQLSKIQNPLVFLRILEETRLFRQNAFFLKYSNNSIICKINGYQQCRQQLRESIIQFQKQRLSFLEDKQRIEVTDEVIQRFFKKMIKNKVLSVMLSIEKQSQMQTQLNESVKITKVLDSQQKHSRALILSIVVIQNKYEFFQPYKFELLLTNPNHVFEPNNKKLVQHNLNKKLQKQKDKQPMIEHVHQFEITYWSVDNQLMLKLTTSYQVRGHQIDIFTNILNSFNFDSITYSFVDNPKKLKSEGKFIALTTRQQLHPKENPFLSIFLCMDKLIICSLLIQHDVRLKNQITSKRKEQIHQTYKHLIVKMQDQWEELTN